MLNHEVYELTQTLQGLLFQRAVHFFQNSLAAEERLHQQGQEPLLQLRRGYAESPAWMMIQVAEFLPDPMTVERFRRRAVYSAPLLVLALLELLASEKWLDRRADGYYLTVRGQEVLETTLMRHRMLFSSGLGLDPDLLNRLEKLMGSVIRVSLKDNSPDLTWCLAHSRARARETETSVIHKIVQYAADFNAFRDDAHMAAYGQYDVAGQVWEAFAYIADKKANSADALFNQLAYRGFSRLEWQEAIDELLNRGWVQYEGSNLSASSSGRLVRESVEEVTDQLFFAPWKSLGKDEIDELLELTRQVIEDCSVVSNGQ